MKGATHLAIGVATATAGVWWARESGLPVEGLDGIAIVGFSAVGSLLPDIDHPTSTASRKVPRALMGKALEIAAPVIVILAALWWLGAGDFVGQAIDAMRPLVGVLLVFVAPAVLLTGVSVILRAFTGHRGVTHSLLFAIAGTVGLSVWCASVGAPWWYGLGLGWGWLTHLLADAMTKRGVPALWWPLKR